MMRVFVEQLEFVGAHGVYDEERRDGRRFLVDMSVDVPDDAGADSDQLVDALDYRALAEIILEVGQGPSCALVEHMAARMLDLAFTRSPLVQRGRVTIRKFATGVPGAPRCVGVTLERARSAPEG